MVTRERMFTTQMTCSRCGGPNSATCGCQKTACLRCGHGDFTRCACPLFSSGGPAASHMGLFGPGGGGRLFGATADEMLQREGEEEETIKRIK